MRSSIPRIGVGSPTVCHIGEGNPEEANAGLRVTVTSNGSLDMQTSGAQVKV